MAHAGHVEGNDLHKRKAGLIQSLFYTEGDSLPINLIKSEESDLEKGAGEGSRGGHVIGHTKNGKPIYATQDNKQLQPGKDFHKTMEGLGFSHTKSENRANSADMLSNFKHKDGYSVDVSQRNPLPGSKANVLAKHIKIESINGSKAHVDAYHNNYNSDSKPHRSTQEGAYVQAAKNTPDNTRYHLGSGMRDIKNTDDLEKHLAHIHDSKEA